MVLTTRGLGREGMMPSTGIFRRGLMALSGVDGTDVDEVLEPTGSTLWSCRASVFTIGLEILRCGVVVVPWWCRNGTWGHGTQITDHWNTKIAL